MYLPSTRLSATRRASPKVSVIINMFSTKTATIVAIQNAIAE